MSLCPTFSFPYLHQRTGAISGQAGVKLTTTLGGSATSATTAVAATPTQQDLEEPVASTQSASLQIAVLVGKRLSWLAHLPTVALLAPIHALSPIVYAELL